MTMSKSITHTILIWRSEEVEQVMEMISAYGGIEVDEILTLPEP